MIKKYLLSNVFWDKENEGGATPPVVEKTQAEKNAAIRDGIESHVAGNNTKDGKENVDEPDKVDEDNKDDEKKEDKDEENKEEGDQEKEEEGEKKEEVEAKEDDPEKLKRTIARLQKRIDKETGSKKELKRQLEAAQTKLEATGEERLTEADVNTRATKIASEEMAKRDFENACLKLNKEAVSIDKTFNKKVMSMAEDIGAIPSQMIGVLEELDNGGAVLNYLTDNVDEAEEIYALSPAKMAVKLSKISTDLIEKAKPKKAISRVPPPNEPIGGGNKSPAILSDKDDMQDWIKKRNQQVEESRKNGRYNLR